MKSDTEMEQEREIQLSEKHFFDRKVRLRAYGEDETIDVKKRASLLKTLGLEGSLEGMKVVECGCGIGWLTSIMAGKKATVTCFDVSSANVKKTMLRAEQNGVHERIQPQVAVVEELPYKDQSFDLVIGIYILHHLADLERAAKEIFRVLKPGRKAIFYETSAQNPILIFSRRHLVGRWGIPKLGSKDEHPLTSEDIQTISSVFNGKCELSYPRFRFFGKISFQMFGNRFKIVKYILQWMDKAVYHCLPFLRRYSFQLMVKLTK